MSVPIWLYGGFRGATLTQWRPKVRQFVGLQERVTGFMAEVGDGCGILRPEPVDRHGCGGAPVWDVHVREEFPAFVE